MACKARDFKGHETDLGDKWEQELKHDIARTGILVHRWSVYALIAAGYTHVQMDDGGWLELKDYAT
jgi:hypothetical protein